MKNVLHIFLVLLAICYAIIVSSYILEFMSYETALDVALRVSGILGVFAVIFLLLPSKDKE